MRISVFGIGYVGAVSGGCLASLGHRVIGADVIPEKVAMLGAGRSPIVEAEIAELIAEAVATGRLTATTDTAEAVAETDVSMIAVGTPSAADGSTSLAAVRAVIRDIGAAIADKPGTHSVVMRSTVPPGTAEEVVIPLLEQASGRRLGDRLQYYSNPEFLREGTAVRDFHAPPFTLIGVPEGDDADVLRELYDQIHAPVHVVPYRIAESVKFLSNAFHALKLAFANEAGAILSEYGVDAPAAFRLFCEDRTLNISPAYLRPGFAFGGSCLPKDVRSFLSLARHKSVAAPMLGQILPSNTAIVERAFDAVAAHGRQTVSLIGLAFKQGTDDLRESPFVTLAERLLGRGFDLRIFDRFVNVAALLGANRSYIDREIPHLERLMLDSPEAAVAHGRIVVVGHLAPDDRPALLAALDGHVVIDLANMPALREAKGVAYQGICW
jgi:GDP-mannose 6-dehydrogenase